MFTMLAMFVKFNECLALKRNAAPDYNLENADSGMDKIHVNYDEYPVCKNNHKIYLKSIDWC